jgi:hypothetical protein
MLDAGVQALADPVVLKTLSAPNRVEPTQNVCPPRYLRRDPIPYFTALQYLRLTDVLQTAPSFGTEKITHGVL